MSTCGVSARVRARLYVFMYVCVSECYGVVCVRGGYIINYFGKSFAAVVATSSRVPEVSSEGASARSSAKFSRFPLGCSHIVPFAR